MIEMTAPYQPHSQTSKAAAKAIEDHLGPMEHRVLDKFTPALSWTDDELIREFGTQSVRPRRIALTQRGFLEDTGQTRKTASGRNAVVWGLVKAQRDLF